MKVVLLILMAPFILVGAIAGLIVSGLTSGFVLTIEWISNL